MLQGRYEYSAYTHRMKEREVVIERVRESTCSLRNTNRAINSLYKIYGRVGGREEGQ